MSIHATQLRRLGGACAALAALAVVTLFATPAQAAGDGYVRLAHLSPDTPAVDVYLKSASNAVKPQTFRGVAYGAISQYLRLPTGTYQVAMRKAGAAASTKPVITTEVGVENGQAYTVAGVGKFADLGLRVLNDDLKLPDAGAAKVRIIQASVQAGVLDVSGANGAAIANGVAFATTTAYREVKPGKWTVLVQPTGGGKKLTMNCTLGAGSVYSLLVLDDKTGGLTTQLHIDAERQGAVPVGAVATGDGGSQPQSQVPMALLFGGLGALVVGGSVIFARRRLQAAA